VPLLFFGICDYLTSIFPSLSAWTRGISSKQYFLGMREVHWNSYMGLNRLRVNICQYRDTDMYRIDICVCVCITPRLIAVSILNIKFTKTGAEYGRRTKIYNTGPQWENQYSVLPLHSDNHYNHLKAVGLQESCVLLLDLIKNWFHRWKWLAQKQNIVYH
jgi:hypothetical protein